MTTLLKEIQKSARRAKSTYTLTVVVARIVENRLFLPRWKGYTKQIKQGLAEEAVPHILKYLMIRSNRFTTEKQIRLYCNQLCDVSFINSVQDIDRENGIIETNNTIYKVEEEGGDIFGDMGKTVMGLFY